MITPPKGWRLPLGSLFLVAAFSACGSSKLTPIDQGNDAGTNEVAVDAHPDGAVEAGPASRDGSLGSGDTASANTCGERHYASFNEVSVIGPANGLPYEGPAIVERNASNGVLNEVILAFTPDGDAGALPMHARIYHLPSDPSLPVGAKVWLAKSANPPFAYSGPLQPSWFALRDKKDGHFFVAAGKDASAALFAPFTFDNKKTTCVGAFDDTCVSGTATYSSVDVHGDSTVAIEDGHTGTVASGGVDYDVNIVSRSIVVNPGNRCADYSGPDQRFGVDIRAKAPASLVTTLEVGPPIACAPDNADQKLVQFTFLDGAAPYDGKVVYSKRRADATFDCFSFETTLTAASGAPAVLEVCASPGLFPEPTVGQELWVTASSNVEALKGPNRGPLLLANVSASAPLDATTTAEIESVLGLSVDTRADCSYAGGSYQPRLWDATLGTTPPVVVRADGHATATVGGKSYGAWMWQDGSALGLNIAAQ